MVRTAGASESFDSRAPWARLLARHRAAWTEELLQGWSVVDLGAAADPVAALADAPDKTAFVWLEGYSDAGDRDRLRASLEEAERRRAPIVVGFETDSDGIGTREAEALLGALQGARVVTQELAAGSLIAPAGGSDTSAARQRSVHTFVCANLEPAALDRSSAELEAAAEPVLTGYVAWLEQAHRELRAANARLARERLGIHDAAAAAVENRRVVLEERIADLEEQVDLWRRQAELNEVKLEAPRYQAVDRLRELAFMLPGLSLLLRLRSRRLGDRWRAEE